MKSVLLMVGYNLERRSLIWWDILVNLIWLFYYVMILYGEDMCCNLSYVVDMMVDWDVMS